MILISCGISNPSYAACQSNPDKKFLCFGDQAWQTGYLLSPQELESLVRQAQLAQLVNPLLDVSSELVEGQKRLSGDLRRFSDHIDELENTEKPTSFWRDAGLVSAGVVVGALGAVVGFLFVHN